MKIDDFEITVYPNVYPPAEDSFLLYDALRIEKEDTFLEIGCGSGIITLKAAKHAQRVVAVDISSEAVRNTIENLRRNNLLHKCNVIKTNLLDAFKKGAKFSKIVWNPPYLPKDDNTTSLDHALVGGRVGIELSLRLVEQVPLYMNRGGILYLVVSSIGNVKRIREMMELVGMKVRITHHESLFFEELQVIQGTIV